MNQRRGRKPYGPQRDLYRSGPILDMLRRDSLSMNSDPYDDPMLLHGLDPLSVQAQVIVIDPERRCRDYAEMFLSKLKRTGLICDIVILDKFTSPSQVIDDATATGLLYTASVNLQNEIHQSVTINILQGQPQEHRNMPYEDALKLISRNFDAHLLKLAGSKPDPALSQPLGEMTDKHGIEEIDPTLSLLLINLAEGKNLRLADLDKVIGFLNQKRARLTGSSSPKRPISTTYQNKQSKPSSTPTNAPKPVQPPSSSAPIVSTQQAEELQAKITQLFGNRNKQQSTVKPVVAAVSSPIQSSSAPSYASSSSSSDRKSKSVGIDFNNPTVQNALQNLMKTGPNILNNIRSTGESSTSSSNTKTEYDSDRDDYKDDSRPAKRAKPGRHAIAGFY
ncbi:nuclear receptor coactivator 5-like [Styela clava]|uniref:nuclear receptor coactivator 5-like n=1 Tax=Styela clava TaxID=7725 RepID=UPI00193A0B08|nr:nuclear receptor coactivator 5-like [Styela clava]